MLFEVERATVSGRSVLRVRGELDLATAPELAQAVEEQLSAASRALIIDLSDTIFLDSTGARQLALSARRAADGGTTLQVVCPPGNRAVRLVIDLLELQTVVPIVDSATALGGTGLAQGEAGP